jgi:hypothetical protein
MLSLEVAARWGDVGQSNSAVYGPFDSGEPFLSCRNHAAAFFSIAELGEEAEAEQDTDINLFDDTRHYRSRLLLEFCAQ